MGSGSKLYGKSQKHSPTYFLCTNAEYDKPCEIEPARQHIVVVQPQREQQLPDPWPGKVHGMA